MTYLEGHMNYKMGWLRDFPDVRDYDVKHQDVQLCKLDEKVLPAEYRISPIPAIKAQGQLGSCTANAGAYMYETFAMKAQIGSVDPLSRLFLYKVSRRLAGSVGDVGAYLRDTMKALALFGVPPEDYWVYNIGDFEKEPTAFEYGIAQNYQATVYYKLDPYGKDADKVIESIKLNLAANRTCIFGFTVYRGCINDGNGEVKLPGFFDSVSGGHAICAVGYDDAKMIGSSQGAFVFANSWGSAWGDAGFGYLPYEYVRKGLATDWWTMMNGEWLDLTVFK
jgi:C1A family cysteine protease